MSTNIISAAPERVAVPEQTTTTYSRYYGVSDSTLGYMQAEADRYVSGYTVEAVTAVPDEATELNSKGRAFVKEQLDGGHKVVKVTAQTYSVFSPGRALGLFDFLTLRAEMDDSQSWIIREIGKAVLGNTGLGDIVRRMMISRYDK